MSGKDKIGMGIRENEAQLPQALLETLAGGNNLIRGRAEITGVFDRLCSHDDRRQVHGIGVEGEFDILQIGNHFLITDGKADPLPGHGPGLGEGLDHQQVVILFKQGQGSLSAEVHIGFINDDNTVGIAGHDPLDLIRRHLQTGRGVGVGDDHAAVLLTGHCRQIIFRPDGEIFLKGRILIGNTVQVCPDIIEGIGDIREQNGTPVGKKSQEAQGQDIVRADADKNLVGIHLIIFRKGIDQHSRVHIGIQTQVTVAIP